MANIDNPRGLWAIKAYSGELPAAIDVSVDSSNATAIFVGDPVAVEADGNVKPSGATATTGAQTIGVVEGVFNSNGSVLKYLPASTAGTLIVRPADNVIFGIQANGSTTSADIGSIHPLVATAGSTTSGMSRYEVNSSSTSSGVVKIVGKTGEVNNDWGTNVNLQVIFAVGFFKNATTV